MKDYRVTVKVRNNRILRAIEAVGGTPGQKWCDANGLPYIQVNNLINMTISPLHGQTGLLRDWASMLCDVVNCLPEDLWSNEQLYPLERNFSELEMSHESVLALLSEERETSYLQDFSDVEREQQADALNRVLSSLTRREEEVLRLRNFENMSLDDIAERLDITRERVRQIEAKGLRKLRHPTRLAVILPAVIDEQSIPIVLRKAQKEAA